MLLVKYQEDSKREGRPGDEATLTARLIDRPIRPLFPKGYRHDVQIMNIVLSVIQIAHQKWQQ